MVTTMIRTIYYESRVILGWAALLPALILPVLALASGLQWASNDITPAAGQLLEVFVIGLPLSAGLAAAHLMSAERDCGFDGLRRSYPESVWRLPLLRLLDALLMLVVSVVAAVWVLWLTVGGFDLVQIILPALSPALWLLMLALLVNNVTGNYWIAAGVVVGYWFMEYTTWGEHSGAFFLFSPLRDPPETGLNVLFLLALAALMLNVLYSQWRRRHG